MRRRIVHIVAVHVAGIVLAGAVAVPATSRVLDEPGPRWTPPVSGAVVREFRHGRGSFDVGGHAGLDYQVARGDAVVASGAGVVAFVGRVAGSSFVVVDHGSDIRTSYAPVLPEVARGERVAGGQRIGRVGGPPPRHHPPSRLHFGLRVAGTPRDPAVLFRPRSLTEIVALVPPDGPPPILRAPSHERRDLLREIAGEGRPWWVGRGRGGSLLQRAVRGATDVVRATVGERAAALRRQFVDTVERAGAWLEAQASTRVGSAFQAASVWGTRAALFGLTLAATRDPRVSAVVAVEGQELLSAVGRGVGDWWRLRRRCSRRAPPAAGFQGTGHHVIAVGGANSTPDVTSNATFPLPLDDLGYSGDDVTWFSYRRGEARYSRRDTHMGPSRAAALLAEQLRRSARIHPGTTVDLIGHSQGGVIIEVFLKEHYAGHESQYPPIGKVVTLASPHGGSALAARYRDIGSSAPIGMVVDRVRSVVDDLPTPTSGTVLELSEGSALLEHLRGRPLPTGVEMTTIGALDDVLVTADRTEVHGATHVVVDPRGIFDHLGVVNDPKAMGEVRLALSGLPPRCRGVLESVVARVQPHVIRSVIAAPDVAMEAWRRSAAPVRR